MHREWLQYGLHPTGLALGEPIRGIVQELVQRLVPQHRVVHLGAVGQADG